MKIHNIQQTNYNQLSFYGRNRCSNILEKIASRDIYSNQRPDEFIQLRDIYNNLWEKLELPNNLKPRLQFKAMLSEMEFSIDNYMIYINKRLSPFKMNLRNKTGKNEALLRHEIEHVKQIWYLIRLVGAENIAEKFDIETSPHLLKKMREIEKTLGKITPESNDYAKAKQYSYALQNYPSPNQNYGILGIKEIIDYLKYKNNLLEREARNEARKYEPSYAITLTTSIQELYKLILN